MNGHWPRAILHCDMDAFFASVEIADFPELQGRPVIVGGDPGTRSVVCAASYEAKIFGIKAGMPVRQAAMLCPNAVFQRPRYRRYIEASEKLISILRDFSPRVEVYSIDEAFVEVTGSQRIFGPAPEIGRLVKERVRTETNLTVSVGCSASRVISKIASDIEKPDGLVVVEPGSEREFLDPLAVEKMIGIGPKTQIVLNAQGIFTLGDLAQCNEYKLHRMFGKVGRTLWLLSNGYDFSDVSGIFLPKTVSNSTTLDRNTTDLEHVSAHLLLLSHCVGMRMRAKNIAGSTVVLRVRWADMHSFTRNQKIPFPTDIDEDIYYTALDLLRGIKIEQPIRLVGVGVTNIEQVTAPHLMTEAQRTKRLDQAMDAIELKWGGGAITRAKLRLYNIVESASNPFILLDSLKCEMEEAS
ncbi:MAG: DNA polymerase IV [Candidatus Brocadiia bacterium]